MCTSEITASPNTHRISICENRDLPHGNVCDVSIAEEDGRTEVAFAADPHGGPECLWFCFRIRSDARSARRIRLVLRHAHTMLGGNDPQNMRPVVRPAKGDWERLGVGTVEDLPDGRSRIAWDIDAPEPFVDVAYCYPYGRPEVDALLRETDGYWRADTIGVSQEGRPIIRLSNGYGGEGDDRSGLYLLARQHAGETPGSWVLDGFLRGIASFGDDAPLIWAAPLANVDGVERGDYGKDNFPYDLNRAWGIPPMRHEALVLQGDIQRWKTRCHPLLAIDFHAPGACETDGIYGFVPDPKKHPQHHQALGRWIAAIENALTPKYAAEPFGQVADYPSRWETPSFASYCWAHHGICGFTIETPYGLIGDLLLTRERYREAGERIATGIVETLCGTP